MHRLLVSGHMPPHDADPGAGAAGGAAWSYQAAPPAAPVSVPMTAGAPSGIVRPLMTTPPAVARLDAQADAAEARLAHARQALADTDLRDDAYAVLWRQVDGLEREVAALHYQAMRAA